VGKGGGLMWPGTIRPTLEGKVCKTLRRETTGEKVPWGTNPPHNRRIKETLNMQGEESLSKFWGNKRSAVFRWSILCQTLRSLKEKTTSQKPQKKKKGSSSDAHSTVEFTIRGLKREKDIICLVVSCSAKRGFIGVD